MHYQLILASTSIYRKQILQKIGLPFTAISPECDETPLAQESATDLVKRLAIAKAQSIKTSTPSLIIGSDQICVMGGDIIGKPHTFDNAFAQLKRFSGQIVTFYTGLALHDSQTQQTQALVEPYQVHFRHLTDEEISGYLHQEKPFDCAGSFKSEGLGISLFSKLEGKDPNTLIGLPLISLLTLLKTHNINPLQRAPLSIGSNSAEQSKARS